jgi:general secretion pathway protein D
MTTAGGSGYADFAAFLKVSVTFLLCDGHILHVAKLQRDLQTPTTPAMLKPPLATTISSLLVCSLIGAPALTFAASVENTAQAERARRADYERRGHEAIANGDKAMKARDYEKAVAYYKSACDIIPNAPLSEGLYNHALHNFCEVSCDLAEQRLTEGRYLDAENTLKLVLDDRYDPRCKRAVIILAHLEQPDYYNRTIGPQFRANVELVKQYFIEARGFYDTGRFDLAAKRCDQILAIDKYNIAARKMHEQIDRAKSDYGVVAYGETRADAMAKIDLAWAKPVRRYELHQTEIIPQDRTLASRTERINLKLNSIIIPKLDLREATIREAIDFLKKKSAELDVNSPVGEKGVNIVLKLDTGGGAAPAPEAAAPAVASIPGLEAIPAAPGATPAAGAIPGGAAAPLVNPADARVTVALTNIPLVEALRYVTSLATLKFKVEPYAVFVVPASVNTDVLITKEWKVRPDLIPRVQGAVDVNPLSAGPTRAGGRGAPTGDQSKGTPGIAEMESAKNWLISNGVQFNGPGASAVYLPGTSRLIVRNTQDQLDLIDTIIESNQTGSASPQIEIEAKFVEIQQTNLKELSFDWTLGQAHVPGNSNVFFGGGTTTTSSSSFPFVDSSGSVVGQNQVTSNNRSGTQAISANAIDALLSGGTTAATATPASFAIAGVFTDPQFQVVIRALNQKKGVDLLSSPRVTTKSGQRAVVEVVEEFRYPTEFQPPQIPQTVGATGGVTGVASSSSSGSFPVTPTTPTAFETRNTGVTLEVEHAIGPDNFTIDLNLVPQVVEFEGFINYGSPIQTTTTNPVTGVSTTSVITPNVINQPIFSTRKVTTSVSVFDGSTVVLGGLMRDDVQKVEDKVPLLGDIPILGRLFRSSVDQHIKTNLIMFVTARLMNPAGDPVRPEDEKEEVVETLAPPTIQSMKELPLLPK